MNNKRCVIGGCYEDISWKFWNEYYPEDKILPKTGFCIHHIDGDHYNNDVDNLIKMTRSEHTSFHMKDKVISEEIRKKISNKNKGENHPLFGKKHSEKTKNKMSSSLIGNKNGAKPVCVNFVRYSTIKKAADTIGVSPKTISYRIKIKIPGYYYI